MAEPDCPVNCSAILRQQRFKAEKQDRPYCLICRRMKTELDKADLSLDAHELTYRRVGYWLSSDISPLCRDCHNIVEQLKPRPCSHCDTFAIVGTLARMWLDFPKIIKDLGYLDDFTRQTGQTVTIYEAWSVCGLLFARDIKLPEKGDYAQFYDRFEQTFGNENREFLQSVRLPSKAN